VEFILRGINSGMTRLDLFPHSARIENDKLTIARHDLSALARQYGTPLYLYDRATMDRSVADYQSALRREYPAPAHITYASKAFLCTAIVQWTQEHNLLVDCTSEGEIAIAVAGGAPPERIVVHGVNKSIADLKSALQHACTIVVDNLPELQRIADLHRLRVTRHPDLWLRLLPGVSVETHHAHTQTGGHDSKFGMTREEIKEAIQIARTANLKVNGIHFHQGSNFRDPGPLVTAIDLGLDLAYEIGFWDEWHFSPGGGWGVAYHEDELPQPDTNEYVRVIAENVVNGCTQRGLSLPHLHLEPGRSLVARAGVALYRVGAIKRRGDKIWLLTDGGMTDNPRYSMYGAPYSCLTVAGPGRERSEKVSIAGPYCESGDILIEDLMMPKVEVGELIAIPVSGAYQLSMSSNYNGARRPAVVWLEAGNVKEIVRRETTDDLLKRDFDL